MPFRFRGFPVYGATEYVTSPLPFPDAPPVIVIHVALLAAVQGQPSGAVTVTLSEPPLTSKVVRVGEIA